MEVEEAFGSALRAMRKRRGLSQEALAHEAGVERNYISLIELGRNSPSIRLVFRLCDALKTAPSVLLNDAEQNLKTSIAKKRGKP
jgi:transcriptional regulator with XRE-family HTH domain